MLFAYCGSMKGLVERIGFDAKRGALRIRRAGM
jgi:hypothetical protein